MGVPADSWRPAVPHPIADSLIKSFTIPRCGGVDTTNRTSLRKSTACRPYRELTTSRTLPFPARTFRGDVFFWPSLKARQSHPNTPPTPMQPPPALTNEKHFIATLDSCKAPVRRPAVCVRATVRWDQYPLPKSPETHRRAVFPGPWGTTCVSPSVSVLPRRSRGSLEIK